MSFEIFTNHILFIRKKSYSLLETHVLRDRREETITTFSSIPHLPNWEPARANLCCTQWKLLHRRSPRGRQLSPGACRNEPLLLSMAFGVLHDVPLSPPLSLTLINLACPPKPFRKYVSLGTHSKSPCFIRRPSGTLCQILPHSPACCDCAYMTNGVMGLPSGWTLGKKILGRRNDSGRNKKYAQLLLRCRKAIHNCWRFFNISSLS